MILYRKVKDIPGSGNTDLDTKEGWSALLDSMNLDFDYMIINKWLVPYSEESLEDRVNRLEKLVNKLIHEV